VAHPDEWEASGYREIQAPLERYSIIDLESLSALCGFKEAAGLQEAHRQWVAEALDEHMSARDPCWSEALAVGRQAFVEEVKRALGGKAKYRETSGANDTYVLREQRAHSQGCVPGSGVRRDCPELGGHRGSRVRLRCEPTTLLREKHDDQAKHGTD
jgi:hypothetical protein